MIGALLVAAIEVTSPGVGESFSLPLAFQKLVVESRLNEVAAPGEKLSCDSAAAIYSVLDGYAARMLTYYHDSGVGSSLKTASNAHAAPYAYAADRTVEGLSLQVSPTKYAQVIGAIGECSFCDQDRAWCLYNASPLPNIEKFNVGETNAFDVATLSGVLSSPEDMDKGIAFRIFNAMATNANASIGSDAISVPYAVTATQTLNFAYANLSDYLATWMDSNEVANASLSVGQFRKKERGILPLMAKIAVQYKESPAFTNYVRAATHTKRAIKEQNASQGVEWSGDKVVFPSLSGHDSQSATNTLAVTETNVTDRAVCGIGNAVSSPRAVAAFSLYAFAEPEIMTWTTSVQCNGILVDEFTIAGGAMMPAPGHEKAVNYTVGESGLSYEVVGDAATNGFNLDFTGKFWAEGVVLRTTAYERTDSFGGVSDTHQNLPPWYNRNATLMHIDCDIASTSSQTNYFIGCGSSTAAHDAISSVAGAVCTNAITASASRFLFAKGDDVAEWMPIPNSYPIAALTACEESYGGEEIQPTIELEYTAFILNYDPIGGEVSPDGYARRPNGEWVAMELSGLRIAHLSAYVLNWDEEHAPTFAFDDDIGYRVESFPAAWWLLLDSRWDNYFMADKQDL